MADPAIKGAVMPFVKAQFFDNNGDIAAGYFLFTYKAGTSTQATTWTTKDQGTANANPIVLSSAGRADIFLDRETAYKFVLSNSADSQDPTESPLWTKDNIVAPPFSTVSTSVTRIASQVQWSETDNSQTLDAPQRPVMLFNKYLGNTTGSGDITIPAGTISPLLSASAGLVLEWEVNYASATLSARSEAFGTAVDIGTGAASTFTRAKYFFEVVDNTSMHVSTRVYQNTGGGAVQFQAGQQTLAGLNLSFNDYTVDMKMSGGTWTIRGARAYLLKTITDWQP